MPLTRCALLAIMFCAIATSCSEPSDSEVPDTRQAEEACEARGGIWDRFGKLQAKRCNLPTTDAGQPCSDSRACEGWCVAPEAADVESSVTGSCDTRVLRFGCFNELDQGTVRLQCVD